MVFCLVVTAAYADESLHSFNIPASTASEGLALFAEQSRMPLIYLNESVRDKHTNRVAGNYTISRALDILLSGTGIAGSINERGVLTVTVAEPGIDSGSKMNGIPESRNGKTSPFTAILAALAAILSVDAGADQEDEEEAARTRLEEILVTATKREARVQDIPLSIAVISNQDIERRGLIGMEDYLRSIPGVNQIDNGPISNAIVIRGITTSPESENFGSGTTVASYFDETPITGAAGLGAGGIDVRPVDIERIELLRGPQGTAYGSASLGGTLRMIPVKPKLDDFSVRVGGSFSGTDGHGSENWMGQGIVNIPIVKEKFAARAVGYRYDESGVYRNVAGVDPTTIAIFENFGLGDLLRGHVQEDVGRIVSTGGRLSALWLVTDKLDLSLNFLTQKIEQDGAPSADIGKYEQVRAPIAPQARVRGEAGEISDTDMDLTSLELNYDIDWAQWKSIVSWVDSGSVWTRDVSSFFLFPISTTAPSDFQSFTVETRLASQLDGRFQFLAGLFFEDVEEDVFQTLDWPGMPSPNPFGTDPMFLFDITRQLDQRAVFGEASYDLTDKLTATVGGRYFEYDKDERGLVEGGLAGVPIGAGVATNLEGSESGSSFKANLSYRPTQDSLLYASWAEGFRLGRPAAGLPSAVCDTDGDGLVDGTNVSIESTRTINSDFVENYELGTKLALFDRRVVVDAAAYHIRWDGLPALTVATACNLTYTANVGAATSDGVELQVSLFPLDGLRLEIGAGYTNAKLSEDAPGLGAEDGARLPGSPEISANLAVQYDFEFAGYGAFLRADSFYVGEFFSDLQETPNSRAGDYIKLDARAGVAIGNFNVEFFVRNLTNEDSFTWRGLFQPTPFHGFRLRPRTVGIQLGYSFGR